MQKMALLPIFCLLLGLITLQLPTANSVRLDADGGYTGLVFKISEDVPEEECDVILTRLKVRPNFYDSLFHFLVGE